MPKKQDNKEGSGKKSSGRFKRFEEKEKYEQQLVDLARVTRVTKGGKRMNFRACVVIGDRSSEVGFGVAKGADVSIAIAKAVEQAKKNIFKPLQTDGALPHAIAAKFKAARIKIRPGKPGRGIIAGGVVRTVLELAGYKDAVAKIFGSKNKVNNVKVVFAALQTLK